jgi:hypothetical protein
VETNKAGVSRFYFCRSFKLVTASVEEFLLYVRANNAKVASYLSRLQTDPLPDFE